MRADFSVTKYWCSTAHAGTRVPTIAAISRPHMPAASITHSASISPWSVTTVVTRRPRFLDRRHAHALQQRDAAGARAGRVRVGEARRIDVAVAFDPRGADDVVELDQREELARLAAADELDVKAESFRHRRRALQFLPARGRRREPQAPDAVPSGRLARLGFELRVELGRVAHEPRQVAAAAKLPDESRRVPRRAMRQLQPLEQDDVALAALREVIRDAAADDAAADDDDATVSRERHAFPVSCQLPRSLSPARNHHVISGRNHAVPL